MMNIIEQITNLLKLNKNKAYEACPFFSGGLMFVHQEVRACCSYKCGLFFEKNYDGGKIDWKKVEKQRKEVIKNAKKGILPESCIGCPDLKIRKWKEDYKVTELFFNHWDQCNCGCVYCIQKGPKEIYLQTEKTHSNFYPALDKLKELYENNMVSENVHVEFIGGDISILKEADELIDLCLEHGVGRMSFHSSCIDYCEGIERAIQKAPRVTFDFSLDCGSRELYKKIKRIDAFDRVIENVRRYTNAASYAKDFFTAKYILLDGLNDNIEEIEKWLQVINSLGIRSTKIEVNFKNYLPGKVDKIQKIPPHYKELYEYYCKRIKELGMENHCWQFSKMIFEEGKILQ